MATDRTAVREYVERRLGLGNYGHLKDVLRDAEGEFPTDAPSKSTFYVWVKAWGQARGRDHSLPWTLASLGIARPDIVLSTLAVVIRESGGRITSLTTAEARWIERLGVAAPAILEPLTWTTEYDATTKQRRHVDGYLPGEIRLLDWARQFVNAETSDDPEYLQSTHALFVAQWARPTHKRED